MKSFTTLDAVAVPIDQPNIDTDQIIPARFLGRARASQVDAMFRDLRFDPAGKSKPDFILNNPAYANARIIVAGRNFGCGSSRENAVTVMLDNGFEAFIAASFGDIFFNNCLQNGALPVKLEEARVASIRHMLHQSPGAKIAIDLQEQVVTGPDGKIDRFDIDSFRKDCLLRGVDDIDLTFTYEEQIERFEAGLARSGPGSSNGDVGSALRAKPL